jgi:hypothetical protein
MKCYCFCDIGSEMQYPLQRSDRVREQQKYYGHHPHQSGSHRMVQDSSLAYPFGIIVLGLFLMSYIVLGGSDVVLNKEEAVRGDRN